MSESPIPAASLRPFVGPGRVVAGRGSSSRAGEELRAIGVTPAAGSVLVVADAVVLDLGLAADALTSLHDAGFTVHVGPGVAREPTPQTITTLAAAADGAPLAAVVAIGGGSAIDAAKLVAAGQANALALTEGLAATADLAPAAPLLAVPTTAGTGAETTSVAMLWHEHRKRIFVHQQLVPRLALLDADLLRAVPAAIVAASGLDAISHAIESLLSAYRTPLTETHSRSALARLARALPAAYGGDRDAHPELLLGAYEAGLALNASVVVGHSLAYAIAARTQLSHGLTCAMALPYCLAYCRPTSAATIASIGPIVGVDADDRAVLDWMRELTRTLQIPASLNDVGIDATAVDDLAAEVLARYPRPNNPVPLQQDSLEQLLLWFCAGDIDAAWHDEAGLEPL